MIIYMSQNWRVVLIFILSFLLMDLGCVSGLLAQIQEDEIDFEVLAATTYKKADTLWKLAEKYYGNPRLWPVIAYVNRIYDDREIPVGAAIYIPVKDAGRPTSKTIIDRLSAEVAELKNEISRVNEERKALETRDEQLTEALKAKDAFARELEEKKAVADGLSAEIARLRAELLRVNEEREAYAAEDEQLTRTLTDREAAIKRLEPMLDKTRAEPEKVEIAPEEGEVEPDVRKPDEDVLTGKPRRSPAGKWQLSLALVAAASFVLSLMRIF